MLQIIKLDFNSPKLFPLSGLLRQNPLNELYQRLDVTVHKDISPNSLDSLHKEVLRQPDDAVVRYLMGYLVRGEQMRYLVICEGAGRSSEVESSLMVRWVVGSILQGVDPLSYFSFQPVLHDWCNKGRGMCCSVCGMAHIKEPLLLIDKSSLCGGSGFPFSLSEWSLTICLTPYNRR